MNPQLLAACERLVLSRERLRQDLRAAAAADAKPAASMASAAANLASTAACAASNANGWALHHLQPVAQRYPFSLMLGAAAGGALFMAFRPWRGVARLAGPALLAVAGAAAPQVLPRLLPRLLPLLLKLAWSALNRRAQVPAPRSEAPAP